MNLKVSTYKWVIFLGLFLAGKNVMFSQEYIFPQQQNKEIVSNEYLYAFSEATKLFLLGNFPQAVNLYNECIKINPNSAASHFQLAKMYLQAGEIKQAREHAKRAVKLNHENVWYLEELAGIYQVSKELDSAIIVYKKQLVRDPENLNTLFIIASLFEKLGIFNEALDYLGQIDGKIGVSKETSMTRFRVYDGMKEEQKALAELRIAYGLSEDDYTIAGMMAEFFRRNDLPDSARKYYQKIYPNFKNDPAVAFSYCEFMLEQKEIPLATEVLSLALTNEDIDDISKAGYLYKIIQDEKLFRLYSPILDPSITGYYTKYYDDLRSVSVFTDIEFRLGNYDKASGALKRIIKLDKSNYLAFEQLIFSENAQGYSDSVKKYTDVAIRLFPEKPVPYLFAGSVSYQSKNFTHAIELLEKGLKISENDNLKLEFYSLLAECYEGTKDYVKSDEYFRKALLLDQENLGISNNYAYYLALREKDLKYARKLSRKTIEKEPENSTYLDTYGWVLFKMGKLNEARKYIVLAIERGGSKNYDILLHYAEILKKLKRDKEAVQIWQRALEFADEQQREELKIKIRETERTMSR